MLSAFHGLNTASSALMASQKMMDIIAQNIANANTPGYSRQRVDLSASDYPLPGAGDMSGAISYQIGAGVEIDAITRARDTFLDTQFQSERSLMGNWDAIEGSLSRAESIFSGLSPAGASSVLDDFWGAWHELANQPDSTAVRRQVVQRGENLATLINRQAAELISEKAALNDQIGLGIDKVNSMASHIAKLNGMIQAVTVEGASPNDLLDERTRLLDQIAQMANITVRPSGNGQVSVFIGTRAIVRDDVSYAISAVADPLTGNQILTWADDGSSVIFQSGELKGLFDARDTYIPGYEQKLDDLASTIISSMNAVHATSFGLDGSTGNDFWTGTDAATIGVNAVLVTDSQKVGASSVLGAAGNNDKAFEILDIRQQELLSGATETIDTFVRSIPVDIGADLQYSRSYVNHSNALIFHLESRRAEISGVNIDEEMAQMMQFQRAFQAAARVLNAQDEMLDILVNRLGTVGR